MASTQTLSLGAHAKSLKTCMDQLRAQRVLQRLWEKDASLWTSDPQTQAAIRNRLGWLRIPQVMAGQTASLHQFTQAVRRGGFTHGLLLGMGGSVLFAEVCRKMFGLTTSALDLAILDTTDPTSIRAHQQRSPLPQLLLIVSSKSGSTVEVSTLSNYFYEMLQRSSDEPGAHCVAITDAETPLAAQAAAWKFRRLFAHGPQTGADVGGRFSALTYFGLVPAALMGIDVDQLLRRAEMMLTRCAPTAALEENPALQLGAVLGSLAQRGFNKLTLIGAPVVEHFGMWAEQLIAESTGKSGQGIAPVCGESLPEVLADPSGRVFLELQLASEWNEAIDRQVKELMADGHPVVRIRWEDRYDLGGEVIKWSLATTIAAAVLQLNPFDEPNVQESKDRTKALLTQYVRDGHLPTEPTLLAEGALALYGPLQSHVLRSVSQCLAEFFQEGRSGEYVALLSFLPRTAALDEAIQTIRTVIAHQLHTPTMLQLGPRYLHSTGQLFKGGPDAGLFLLLTADESEDLAIPGESFPFGILKQAQALGDFQAMRQRGRRILHVHLRSDPGRAIQQLVQAVGEATALAARR